MTNHLQNRAFTVSIKSTLPVMADTVRGTHIVDLTYHVAPYDARSDACTNVFE